MVQERRRSSGGSSRRSSSRRRSSIQGQLSYPTVTDSPVPFKDPVPSSRGRRDDDEDDEETLLKQLKDDGSDDKLYFKPPVDTRLELRKPRCFFDIDVDPWAPLYQVPRTKKQLRAMRERKKMVEQLLNFCKFDELKLKKPPHAKMWDVEMEGIPSPDVSQARVVPHKPSVSPSMSYPHLPDSEKIIADVDRLKSGIVINETVIPRQEAVDSFDLVYHRQPRPGFDTVLEKKPKKKKKRRRSFPKRLSVGEDEQEGEERPKKTKKRKKKKKTSVVEETMEKQTKGDLSAVPFTPTKDDIPSARPDDTTIKLEEIEGGVGFPSVLGEQEGMLQEGEESDLEESYLTKLFRRKVSQASKATSLHSKELTEFGAGLEEEEIEGEPVLNKLIQKFRRDSEEQRYKPPPRKIYRGTLESHSFTRLKQKTLKNFIYGTLSGTIHQGSNVFPEISRDHQGICMPIAAYCYAILRHPDNWREKCIDEILEAGDQLYQDSLSNIHHHEPGKTLDPDELEKYCYIGEYKLEFLVKEPFVTGKVRSKSKTVYNITKALKIFFKKFRAGIFQTEGHDILIWKDKFYYLFDAIPRNDDLYPDPAHGFAHLTILYDIPDMVTVFLNHTNMNNTPFIISQVSVMKIKNKDAVEEDEQLTSEGSVYNIVDANKAVVLGSYDLGDRCFGFTRNKQALACAVIGLTYSRISPPTSWRRKTIDKIMVIANQLYIECMKCEDFEEELKLDDLPAIFTLGPYLVTIHIYSNLFTELMWKKSEWFIGKALEDFFETHSNAIVQIGRYTVAIWYQRNMYYCFDPYARNREGLANRNGSACVSMNAKLETLVETLTSNFDDKEAIFFIHGLKILKIHRDPELSKIFPVSISLDAYPSDKFKQYKMKKSKEKATDKAVTVDYTELAMEKTFAGDFREGSIVEVGSTVGSLISGEIPPMVHTPHPDMLPRVSLLDREQVADLDSPSLSDTQIEPQRPKPMPEDSERDAATFGLTMEEQELMGGGEDEGYMGEAGFGFGAGDYGDLGEGEGVDEIDEMYLAMHTFAQVDSHSLASYHSKISMQVNTELTAAYFPTKLKKIRAQNISDIVKAKREKEQRRRRRSVYEQEPVPEVTQSQELAKESNFVTMPDDSQLIRGTTNMAVYGENVEFLAPFVCIMAVAVAKKFELCTWSTEIVDYILKCGSILFKAVKVRYDQVPVLGIPRVSLGKTDYSIYVEYVYDSKMKPSILELALKKVLFPVCPNGILITPNYACAVFTNNHLYYLFDGFGNNELGLSDGPEDLGQACVSRFKTIHGLVKRIIYNKTKREEECPLKYTKFVLSSCTVNRIPVDPNARLKERMTRKQKMEMEMEKEQAAAAGEDGGEGKPPSAPKEKDEKEKEPCNLVGYQKYKGTYTIQGTKALKGRATASTELKNDHFVCLCAAIMLLNCPIKKWDTRKVDYVIDQGKHIFSHAEDLDISEKRIIRNILICKNFFDIIVKKIHIEDWKKNKNLEIGIDTLLEKKLHYFLIQFANTCYVIHVSDDGNYHLFDPYPCLKSGRKDPKEKGKAGWIMYKNLKKLKRRIRKDIIKGGESYSFYNFEILAVKKAPKKIVVTHRLMQYEQKKEKKEEKITGKTFFEDATWLEVDPIPWSVRQTKTPAGKEKFKADNLWHDWNIEIPHSLYSLFGSMHQNSTQFDPKTRGRQTLANLTVAIAMIDIYELKEWNQAILDSILVNGDNYFKECVKDIEEEDYDVQFADLIEECSIFPYAFDTYFVPVVEGTVFVVHPKQFNLYKALRAFFDGYEGRTGIICVTKDTRKRHVAFGKVQEGEYFMYDCESYGPPMFNEKEGVAYCLRCTTLKRLIHVLTVTLRGGDFCLYQVEILHFRAMA